MKIKRVLGRIGRKKNFDFPWLWP